VDGDDAAGAHRAQVAPAGRRLEARERARVRAPGGDDHDVRLPAHDLLEADLGPARARVAEGVAAARGRAQLARERAGSGGARSDAARLSARASRPSMRPTWRARRSASATLSGFAA